jgi:Domain of unknown function (DUF5615)
VSLALLLDEMHAPVVAAKLRDRGHDVLAVAEQDDLRALTDEQLFRWASERDRRIVTENVKDFAPLLRRAEELRHHAAPLLFTSSRTFPRTRRNPGPMIDALDTGCAPRRRASRRWRTGSSPPNAGLRSIKWRRPRTHRGVDRSESLATKGCHSTTAKWGRESNLRVWVAICQQSISPALGMVSALASRTC